MSDDKIKSNCLNEAVVLQAMFVPTDTMRRAKSAFWIKFAQSPMADEANITQSMAVRLSGSSSVAEWWKMVGFRDWFTNKMEWATEIESLAHLALRVARDILNDPEAPATAKVNLIGKIGELANKIPAKTKEIKYVDKTIGDMNEDQLAEYIAKNTSKEA